jgi:hypothetical protein
MQKGVHLIKVLTPISRFPKRFHVLTCFRFLFTKEKEEHLYRLYRVR